MQVAGNSVSVPISSLMHGGKHIDVGKAPAGLLLSRDGQMLIVANRDDNQIVFSIGHHCLIW